MEWQDQDFLSSEAIGVQRFLEAIIRHAEVDAERVGSFLEANGVKPNKGTAVAPLIPLAPVANMLLNLGAALRLRTWEKAGLRPRLPENLPTSAQATHAAGECVSTEQSGQVGTEISMTVFRTLIERFAQDGQIELKADLVSDVVVDEDFLKRIAEFFWASHVALSSEKKREVGE